MYHVFCVIPESCDVILTPNSKIKDKVKEKVQEKEK